jgi:hypothetical protein
MRLALLTTRLFERPTSGGELCTARLLLALAEGNHELTCIGHGRAAMRAFGVAATLSLGDEVLPFAQLPLRRRVALLARVLLSGQATTAWRHSGPRAPGRVRAWLAEACRRGLDAVIVDHLQPWAWLTPAPPMQPLVLMHNLESRLYAEQAATAGTPARAWLLREARLLARLERRMFEHAAGVACLSERDARALREQAAARGRVPPVTVLPGFPLAAPTGGAHAPAAMRRVGMFGTWTWGPNRAALHWMLNEVLPRLPAACRLVLAGRGLAALCLPPGVQALHEVADPSAFYDAVDVVALPALQGSGVQEKAIEALASERVVVASPLALRGLAAGPSLGVHAACDAATFARLCAEVPLALDAPARAGRGAWAARRRALYAERLAAWLALGARPPTPGPGS